MIGRVSIFTNGKLKFSNQFSRSLLIILNLVAHNKTNIPNPPSHDTLIDNSH